MKKNKALARILPPSTKLPESYKSAKTIEEVEKDISMAMEDISDYKRDLTKFNTPQVQEFPFFSLPNTRRELVNEALESLWHFNKKSLSTIGKALETQNQNTDSLNHLIRILAVAEAELYTELNRLAKVDKKQAENVNKLSADIKDTATKTNSLSKIQVKMALLRNESLTNLGERFTQIDDNISQKADKTELENITALLVAQQSTIDDKADKTDLDKYIKVGAVYTKQEFNILLRGKVKHLWIAYGITTATLVAGLIASFLI